MNDDMLSQDEIDALLKAGNSSSDNGDSDSSNDPTANAGGAKDQLNEGQPSSSSTNESNNADDYLSPIEQDALGEIGNIAFGSASTALSTLLNQKVDITTPKITMVTQDKLQEDFPTPHIAVHVNYVDGFEGMNLLVMREEDAAVIADLMLGGDGQSPDPELSDMHLSAVQEAMNQMMGSAATSMSTIFNERVDISPPSIDVFDVNKDETNPFSNEHVLIKVSFHIKVGNLIDSNIMQLLQISFARQMVDGLLHGESKSSEEQPTKEKPGHLQQQIAEQPAKQDGIQQNKTPTDHGQFAGQVEGVAQQQRPHSVPEPSVTRSASVQPQADVQAVQFTNFDSPDQGIQADTRNLDLLMDIPLQVTVELGRTKRTVKEILDLSPGSILELDKLAGERVDILINNKLVAKGEVVVIEENFGVRVTDILSREERLQRLNQ